MELPLLAVSLVAELTPRLRTSEPPQLLHPAFSSPTLIDDPLLFGILPPRHLLPNRWSLGSADICFTTPLKTAFFSSGHVLPTYRLHRSPSLGGLWQPTLHLLPRLLDKGEWVHIFPEGRIQQHPLHQMRYFKWGVARGILEAEQHPVVVAIWLQGLEEVMGEDRGWPRWLPRGGKRVRIVVGAPNEEGWEDLRGRWKELVKKEEGRGVRVTGDLGSWELRQGEEAKALRVEATRRVREMVLELRRGEGWPEEEQGAGTPEYYQTPGMREKEGLLADGARVKDT
ncbi:Similar to Lysophosphatidylcholine acyltransferase; acc. no. Q06510 [Pyronema omphalodes CBS 100304]|uniref:Tafazzin family protein n=1 Tax=Pyronema omphalodes (strain CBS 100304) TaxID=1076935 RepID=U4KYG5_PYROM|nr:Similar to Lysophosphatidylcholine acyltransferase; acc. no. Q06510 [Pyronema omphalodes CBS 100304]